MKSLLLAHSKSPGKLILSGEHSTVYGKVSIEFYLAILIEFFFVVSFRKNSVATTVDLYTECEIFAINDGTIRLQFCNLDYEKTWPLELLKNCPKLISDIDAFRFNGEESLMKINQLWNELQSEPTNISHSCLAFLFLYLSIGDLSERKSIKIVVKSNLPNGAGLGSSSAFIVSMAQALFTASQVSIDKKEFNRWCWEMDKIFHGKPSGVDNSICTYGGAILFRNGQLVEQIDHKDLPELKVILVNTQVPRNTKNMVEQCRQRLTIFTDIGNHLLELLNSLSQQVWSTLKDQSGGNLNQLSTLFEMNQHLLNCLNVGHEKIDEIVAIAKRHDLSAKLTGAGGGGVVMIYLNSMLDE